MNEMCACDNCGEQCPTEDLLLQGKSEVCQACYEACSEENLPKDNIPQMTESTITFDKFMDRILLNETSQSKMKTVSDSPLRARIARNQDRPLNRTRYGKK